MSPAMHTKPATNLHRTLPHYSFIKSRLPDWMTDSTAAQRTELRSALLKNAASRLLVANILSQLKSIEIFAEPILELEIRSRAPELRDMQAATLVIRRKKYNLLGLIPIYDTSPEYSLLEAALYNFEEWETHASAFESGSAIYCSGKTAGLESGLRPEVFARCCRTLDLGRAYLDHLREILDLDRPADELMILASKRKHFVRHEQSRFEVLLQMAFMKKDITPKCQERLKYFLLPARKRAGELPLFHRVQFLELTLPGVIHFTSDPDNSSGPCAIYFPEHPGCEFKEYPSLVAFQEDYQEQMLSSGFRQLVSRLMPIDHQGRLLTARIGKAVSGRSQAQLRDLISLSRIEGDLFEDIHSQRLRRLESDAGRLMTHSARADALAREQLLEEFQTAREDLLATLKNLAPRFHQTLLAPPGGQLAATVYQDFFIWSPTQVNAGLMHLLNVLEAPANGRTATPTDGLPELLPVRFRGRTRLWKRDLTPYQSAIKPPDAHWQANSLGVYAWTKAIVLKLDQQYYRVEHDEDTDHWHIVLAGYPDVYRPLLQHNCVGAWRTIHEKVSTWSKQQLITRLGPHAARLSEALANAALPLSGTNLHTLRQIHHYGRRTPPLLLDSLKRLWIFQEIDDFDLDRAKGTVISQLSPRIQCYLLTRLPGWPANKALAVLSSGPQAVIQYGAGVNLVNISEQRWTAGRLLEVVLGALDQKEIDALLESHISHLDQANQLALNLQAQAKRNSLALFEHLYLETEQLDTPVQRQLREEHPELPKSHLVDAIFSLGLQKQPRPETAPALNREIDRALEQVRISRVFEGLYPGWPHAQQSDRLAFSLLETLETWPQDIRLELWDPDIDTTVALETIGEHDSLTCRRLKKTGAFYQLQDRRGHTLSGPHDLYAGVWLAMPKLTQQSLNSAHGISLDEKQAALDLKRAIFAQASRLRSQVPALRGPHLASGRSGTGTPTRLPESFAVRGTILSGLELHDGIYQNLNHRPVAAHAHLHYIRDGSRYYPVRQVAEGWRLLNARNPYSFYQPLLQHQADGQWAVYRDAGPSVPSGTGTLQVQTESGAPAETTDDKYFTTDERQRMRTRKSYRSHLNSPLTYDRVDNGRYPLRDLEGEPLTVVAIHYSEAEGSRQSRARAEQIVPYLQSQGHEKVARLYEDKLEITRFEHDDMRSPQEEHLVGRFLVSARRYLGRGEILGVHGGMLTPLIVSHHRRDPFAAGVRMDATAELISFRKGRPEPTAPCLSGDNILSRINTIYEYSNAVPVRQARSGYNVEPVAFAVDVRGRDGSLEKNRYFVTALFTSRVIYGFRELRVNHGYTWQQIQTLEAVSPSRQAPRG
ncbi:dermonecrotic toxin domain-containing protein [Pseudomonas gingeri]